jgi:hypothetical protein
MESPILGVPDLRGKILCFDFKKSYSRDTKKRPRSEERGQKREPCFVFNKSSSFVMKKNISHFARFFQRFCKT